MKIIQIQAVKGDEGENNSIYGLGDNGTLYYYNRDKEYWFPLITSQEVKE